MLVDAGRDCQSRMKAAQARRRPARAAACVRRRAWPGRHAIERLKVDVPIWKKEVYVDGEVWVDLSMEQFFSHNQIKNDIGFTLTGLIKAERLGRYVPDGMLLTNVEANACGTPCVAADSPGLRDSVLAGQTGLLYPYGDVPALAERLVRLLTDAGLRARMERGALAWAAQLTWERCGAETLALVERVAGADARAAAVH